MARKQARPHVIGLQDMVEMFDMTEGSVQQWRIRGVLPEPLRVIGRTPVWLYSDIVAWAKETGRTIKNPLAPPR